MVGCKIKQVESDCVAQRIDLAEMDHWTVLSDIKL